MIRSLDEAWNWYEAVRTLALDMKRIAAKWDEPALAEVLGRENRFRERSAADLRVHAETILEDLGDLAILVLFSVFEANVRDRAKAEVERETSQITHIAVQKAIKDLKDSIETGSFGKVTEAYKQMDVNLTEEVNQVRRYRNWVAHGRREALRVANVDPETAEERLRLYLEKLAEVETSRANSPSGVGIPSVTLDSPSRETPKPDP